MKRRMKKKGSSMAMQLVIVIAMLLITFLVWKYGVLDRLSGLLISVGTQIDTTQMDVCQGIGEKRHGTGTRFVTLTDTDEDQLPDYICDTCICRDGFGGREYAEDSVCYLFGLSSDSASLSDDLYRKVLGVPDGVTTPPKVRCFHDAESGELSENNYCSPNNLNIDISDTDDDFLPDICDLRPDKHEASSKLDCYKGPINVNGEGIIGVVYPQKIEYGLSDSSLQCVFAICSPFNNVLIKDGIYDRYCPQKYCKIGNNEPDRTGTIFEGPYELPGSDYSQGCYCLGENTETSNEYKNKYVICGKKKDKSFEVCSHDNGRPICS